MIPLTICLVFGFIVAFTGPAFDEERQKVFGILGDFLERRQLRLDHPRAKVRYLPSGCCRPTPMDGRCLDPGCAICQSRRSQ